MIAYGIGFGLMALGGGIAIYYGKRIERTCDRIIENCDRISKFLNSPAAYAVQRNGLGEVKINYD